METLQTIKQLKKNNEDFEWYPTTNEILESMFWNIKDHKKNYWYKNLKESTKKVLEYEYQSVSILDIGAGNCKIFKKFKELSDAQLEFDEYDNKLNDNQLCIHKYMVIEKANTLLELMPSDAVVVGTEFYENTLIDKQADIVFCNPPYSEYAQWSEKIIKEANASYIYLVIPQRWGTNRGIAEAIKKRQAKVSIVGNFDFLNSEDRKARAKVSLVKIDLTYRKKRGRYDNKEVNVDPFDLWFNETFKIQADKTSQDDWQLQEQKRKNQQEHIKNALVDAKDIVSTLVTIYNRDLQKLIDNYLKLSNLDAELFRELNVDLKNILTAFKEKIQGLKSLYWEEIFNNFDKITARLTSKTRDRLLKKMAANTNIDFTEGNIRSVVLWIVKNANKYFDEQMLEIYDDITSEEGIKLYKSNQHFQKDTWRYLKDEIKKGAVKYALDYRVILHGYRDSWDNRNNALTNAQKIQISDITIIAKNLGFSIEDFNSNFFTLGEKEHIYFPIKRERKLKKGTKTHCGKIDEVYVITDKECQKIQGLYQYEIDGNYFHYDSVKTDDDVFVALRSYKNGNIHYQFNQNFIKKLNLEVSRLKGWVKSPKEAAEEFDISIEEATENWNSSYTLLPTHLNNLLPQIIQDEPEENVEVKKEEIEISNLYNDDQLKTFENGTLFDVA